MVGKQCISLTNIQMKSIMNSFTVFNCGFVNNTAQTIKVGSIDAISDYDRYSHGYKIVEFSSAPYTLQENKNMYGKVTDPVELLAYGS